TDIVGISVDVFLDSESMMLSRPEHPGLSAGGALVLALLVATAAIAWDEPFQDQRPIAVRPTLQLPVEPAAFDSTLTMQQPATAPVAGGADPGMIAAGQSAFSRSCTSCHDEQRSLQKSKSYAGWLSTVQRMASKEGADINSADIAPIASYLASVAGSTAGGGGGGGEGGGGWSFASTVSLLHRSASDAYPLENPGFFADVWVTAGYQSSGPWQATVTACTSCH